MRHCYNEPLFAQCFGEDGYLLNQGQYDDFKGRNNTRWKIMTVIDKML